MRWLEDSNAIILFDKAEKYQKLLNKETDSGTMIYKQPLTKK